MAPKTNREIELEKQMAVLQAQVAMLLDQQGTGRQSVTTVVGKPVVGIRNISSYTIGLINRIPGEQGEVQLHPEFYEYNPNARATVSFQFWQQLRKGEFVRKGMIMRDDSFLHGENVAPADNPEDLAAEFTRNAVEDPFLWIEGRTDEELRRDIAAMTSEPTLRRLHAAIDRKIWEIGEEKYKDDEERAKKAIADLPSKYSYAEQRILDRLDEFRPNYKNYSNESKLTVRL